MPLAEFVTCWQRYERADFHFQALSAQWRGLLEAEPYQARVSVDDGGAGWVWVSAQYDPLPVTFSLELGEMLYQLRAALDSCIYAIAIRETGKDPPPASDRLEFPLTRSPEAFARAQWKIAPLSPEFRPVIEAVQPYNAATATGDRRALCAALGVLNEWARIDRHRRLHVLGSWAASAKPELKLPKGVTIAQMNVAPDGFLDAERPVATFRLSGYRPGMRIEANPQVLISMGVNEPPFPTDEDAMWPKRATAIFAGVKALIQLFENALMGKGEF